jgi:lipopolysaccharide exporter
VSAPERTAEPDTAPDILDTQAAGGKAIRGGALRGGAFGLVMLFSLLAVPFMVRHLGAVDYGYYITVSSIVFIAVAITDVGLTNLGTREAAALDGHARTHFLRHLVGLRIVLTGAGLAVAVLLTWATGAPPEIVAGTAIVGFALLLGSMQKAYVIHFNVQLRLGWVSLLTILGSAILNGAFIALVVVGAGLTAFYWANVVAAVPILLFTFVLVRRHGILRPAFGRSVWYRLVRETLPYAAAAAVGAIYSRIAVVLMSYVSTGEETGIFSAAFRIIEVGGQIPSMIVGSMLPILARAARDDPARLRYALQRIFEVSLILGSGLALTLAVGAPFAIEVIGGAGFGDSVSVLRLLAVTLLLTFVGAGRVFALLTLKRYRDLLLGNVVAVVIVVTGTVVLAPSLGADGAAIATVAGGLALNGVSFYLLSRASPELSPRLTVAPRVALAAAAAVGVAIALGSSLPSVVLAALAGLVFGSIVVVTRAVPPELFDALRGRTPDEPLASATARDP